MSRDDDFARKIDESERERRRQERRKKWDERSKSFWKTFLFTENGKPKSGFMVYSFCLSIVFIALYIGAFALIGGEGWRALTESWPAAASNALGSLIVSAAVCLVGYVLHRLFKDKRLMLGTYLWLLLYTLASVIYMAFYTRGDAELFSLFMNFALWFAVIPSVLGTALFFFLSRRDYRPAPPAEEEPEWKKYVRRR